MENLKNHLILALFFVLSLSLWLYVESKKQAAYQCDIFGTNFVISSEFLFFF